MPFMGLGVFLEGDEACLGKCEGVLMIAKLILVHGIRRWVEEIYSP